MAAAVLVESAVSDEKPLHVQVAEALGCKPARVRARAPLGEYWRCGCPPQRYCYPHNGVGVDGAPGEGGEIEAYDTDWSATGPLIEKLEIGILPPTIDRAWVARGDAGRSALRVEGSTPLIAACNLLLALHAAGQLPK